METITIVVGPASLIVVDGKVKKSRQKYYAPGLEIYVSGRVSVARRDAVHYLAMSECLARHIPVRALVSYGWV